MTGQTTSRFEERLKEINEGKVSKEKFLVQLAEEFKGNFNSLSGSIKEREKGSSIGKCPVCGKKIMEGKTNYYCTGYKEGCKFSVSKEILGKKISETQVKKLLEHGKTDFFKGFKGKKGDFDAALAFCKGKINFIFTNESKNKRKGS